MRTFIKKTLTYALVTTYLTQIFSPVVHAMEETSPPPEYRLSFKSNASRESYRLKISRREQDKFEKVYQFNIDQRGAHLSKLPEEGTQNDPMREAFLNAHINVDKQHDHMGYATWHLPQVGTFKLYRDGNVVVDAPVKDSFLSSYDVILKTSGEALTVQNLCVRTLTLGSHKETSIEGLLNVDHLHTNQKLFNKGGVTVKKSLNGEGVFLNHGHLHLGEEGKTTLHEPTIIGIRQFTNKKKGALTPTVQASFVHVKEDNQSFHNGTGGEIHISDRLMISKKSDAPITNKGRVIAYHTASDRSLVNEGSWQGSYMASHDIRNTGFMKVKGNITATHNFDNEGTIQGLERLSVLNIGKNTGTIQGPKLVVHTHKKFFNDGKMNVQTITGDGRFQNNNFLRFMGEEKDNPSVIEVAHFCNEGRMQGKFIRVVDSEFVSGAKGDLKVDTLSFLLMKNSKGQAVNNGKATLKKIIIEQKKPLQDDLDDLFNNIVYGVDSPDADRFPNFIFTNGGSLEVDQLSFLNIGEDTGKTQDPKLLVHAHENFINDGKMNVKTVTGNGRFRNNNLLRFTGEDEYNPSVIEIAYFCNEGRMQGKFIQVVDSHFVNGTKGDLKVDTLFFFLKEELKGQALNNGKAIVKKIIIDYKKPLWESLDDLWNYIVDGVDSSDSDRFTDFSISNAGSLEVDQLISKVSGFKGVNEGQIKINEQGICTGPQGEWLNRQNATFFAKNLTTPFSFSNFGTAEIEDTLTTNRLNNDDESTMTCGKVVLGDEGTLTNAKKADLQILNEFQTGDATINNSGTLLTKGSFTQESGNLTNTGTWTHEGDINTGSTFLRNNSGSIIWRNGKWSFEQREHYNQGHLVFDGMTCDQKITFHNYKTLSFMNSTLTFDALVNFQKNSVIEFISGQYAMTGGLQNHDSVIKFLSEDWFVTDKPQNEASNRLLLTETAPQGFSSTGDIESEKTFTYDLETFPRAIRSTHRVCIQRSNRSLMDLHKISALENVSFHCGPITLTEDFECLNIHHVLLNVTGNFKSSHAVKFRGLTLRIFDGSLSLGESNTKMGMLAAMDNSLSVTADSIDCRFGKVYGAGPTTLRATKGDLVCGQAVSLPGYVGMGYMHHYYAGNIYVNVNYYEGNGAFIASNQRLTLIGKNIILDYGQVKSNGDARFESNNKISAVRSIIQGAGTGHWVAPLIYIGCAPMQHGKMYVVPWCPNEETSALKSKGSEVHFTGSIWFNSDDVTNYGSKITSRQKIFLQYNGKFVDLINNPHDRPPTFKMINCVAMYAAGSNLASLQCAEEVQFQLGECVISGTLSTMKLRIHNLGDTLIRDTGARRTIPSTVPVFNLTELFRQNAQSDALCRQTQQGEIETEFPMGSPYHHPQVHAIELEPQYGNPPSKLDSGVNPLRYLPSNMFNLWLQQLMAQQMGRVYTTCDVMNNDLQRTFWGNNERLFHATKKKILSLEEVQQQTREIMLFEGMKQVAGVLERHTYLAIPPKEFTQDGGVSGQVVEIESEGNIRVEDGDVAAEEDLKMHAGKEMQIVSTVKTYYDDNKGLTFQQIDHPSTIRCHKGKAKVTGQTGFLLQGADLTAKGNVIAGSEEGNTDIQDVHMVHTTVQREEKNNWYGGSKTRTTTTSTVTSRSSNIGADMEGEGTLTLLSGKNKQTALRGSHAHSPKAIIFQGGGTAVSASMGYNKESSNVTTEGPFSSSSSVSRQCMPVFFGSSLCAPLIQLPANGREVEITGSDIVCFMFDAAKAGQVTCSPTVGRVRYFQQSQGRSPLAGYDVGSEGYQDIAHLTRVRAKKMVLNMDPALHHVMTSVDWHPDAIEILGNYVEETVQLDHHHREWSHQHQTIPAPVVQALALAAAYFTGGLSLAGGSVGGVMLQAGIQAASAQFVASFASHGDPLRAWGEVLTDKSLKSIGAAMVSAGVLNKIAPFVSMGPGQVGIKANLCKYATKNMVAAGTSFAIQGGSFDKVFRQALRQTALDTGAAVGANFIGINVQDQFMNMVAHMGLGAGVSALMGENPWEGAAAAAFSKVMAINFADPEDLESELQQEGHSPQDKDYKEKFAEKRQDRFERITLATAFVMAMFGKMPDASAYVARNLLENNWGATTCTLLPDLEDEEEEREDDPFYQKLYLELAQESLNRERQAQLQKPARNIIFADSEFSVFEMSEDEWVKGFNLSIDVAAFIPNLLGVACFAGGVGRDLYYHETTVGEVLFNMAAGYGIFKAAQFSYRGIKILYKSGKQRIVRWGGHVAAKLVGTFQSSKQFVREIFEAGYGKLYGRPYNPNQVPSTRAPQNDVSPFIPYDIYLHDALPSVPGLTHFEGSVQMHQADVLSISVGYFEGKGVNLFSYIRYLQDRARFHGATRMEIVSKYDNISIQNIFEKRYGLIPYHWDNKFKIMKFEWVENLGRWQSTLSPVKPLKTQNNFSTASREMSAKTTDLPAMASHASGLSNVQRYSGVPQNKGASFDAYHLGLDDILPYVSGVTKFEALVNMPHNSLLTINLVDFQGQGINFFSVLRRFQDLAYFHGATKVELMARYEKLPDFTHMKALQDRAMNVLQKRYGLTAHPVQDNVKIIAFTLKKNKTNKWQRVHPVSPILRSQNNVTSAAKEKTIGKMNVAPFKIYELGVKDILPAAPGVTEFKGYFAMTQPKIVSISVENIEGNRVNVFSVIQRLQDIAYLNGARLMEIATQQDNSRLLKVLQKRYNFTPRPSGDGYTGMQFKFNVKKNKWQNIPSRVTPVKKNVLSGGRKVILDNKDLLITAPRASGLQNISRYSQVPNNEGATFKFYNIGLHDVLPFAPGLTKFVGSVDMHRPGVLSVYLGSVEGEKVNIISVIRRLQDIAYLHGASQMEIIAKFNNLHVQGVFQKRYGLVSHPLRNDLKKMKFEWVESQGQWKSLLSPVKPPQGPTEFSQW